MLLGTSQKERNTNTLAGEKVDKGFSALVSPRVASKIVYKIFFPRRCGKRACPCLARFAAALPSSNDVSLMQW